MTQKSEVHVADALAILTSTLEKACKCNHCRR
jgi:hypothetical protein